MVKLLQKQEILPASHAAPSFVCVDVVVRSTIFLSDPYAQLMDQFVVDVVDRIIGEKSFVHQSLTKSKKRQVVAPKGKPNAEKRLHSLEAHDEIEDSPEASFLYSCIFIPYQ